MIMEITKIWLGILFVAVSATHSVLSTTSGKKDNSDADVFGQILKANREHTPGGGVMMSESSDDLFEGDIIKGKNFDTDMEAMKNGVVNDALKTGKWPNGRVPYVFRAGVNSRLRSAVRQAIDEFNAKTCVRFVPRTQADRNFIEFYPGGGCSSYIGRRGGKQPVSLGSGCETKGVAIHEMMHAIGFWHEQSRRDRDSYIRVLTANIIPSMIYNFQKYRDGSSTTHGFAYDKRSVMHYGNYAFSRNGRKTIESLSNPNERLGQRSGMSTIDSQQINAHYSCATTVTTSSPVVTIAPPIECQDAQPFCRELNTRWCGTNAWVKSNCKQRCGLCPTPCEDKNSSCRFWARTYCNHSLYGRYMRGNCAKSCGFCR